MSAKRVLDELGETGMTFLEAVYRISGEGSRQVSFHALDGEAVMSVCDKNSTITVRLCDLSGPTGNDLYKAFRAAELDTSA